MSYKDSIEYIKKMFSELSVGSEESKLSFDAYYDVIDAMERQIPKGVVPKSHKVHDFVMDSYKDQIMLHCPRCYAVVLWGDEIPQDIDNFCGSCGQRLRFDEVGGGHE